MKKVFKSLFLGLLGLTMLASCGGDPAASTSEVPASTSEQVSSSEVTPTIGDENWIYYAENKVCKLGLDPEGKSFLTDGIEEVTLYKAVDGDTAHFNMANGGILKSRFYGIDTPESTGSVQPYGRAAKKYTKARLEAAKTIVVSGTSFEYEPPEADSTGSRYVSLIWYSEEENANYEDLILLNLELVEYGYTWVKNASDIPTYSSTFFAAEEQAKTYKLVLHSGLDDPDFNYGDYREVSLMEVRDATFAKMAGEVDEHAFDNVKVRIQGAVAGFANNIIYLQDFCFYTDDSGNPIYKDGTENPDKVVIEGETGEYCGVNIFAGMRTIPSKFKTIGNYIQVCCLGNDDESYGFQFTDADFPTISYSDTDSTLLYAYNDESMPVENRLHVFDMSFSELSTVAASTTVREKFQYANMRVNLNDEAGIEITGGYTSTDGDITLYTSNNELSLYLTFNYKPYGTGSAESWTSHEDFVGLHFQVACALSIHHTTSGNIRLSLAVGRNEDLVWVDMPTEEA